MKKTALSLLAATLLFSCSENKTTKTEETVKAPVEKKTPEDKVEAKTPVAPVKKPLPKPTMDLLIAIKKNDLDQVKRHMQHSPLVSSDNPDYKNHPVTYAITNNRQEVLKVLLERYSPDIIVNKRVSLLVFAAIKNQTECVKVFIESGADVNVLNPAPGADVTPLGWAVMNRNLDMIKILIKAGSDVNMVNYPTSDSVTALDISLQRNYKKCHAVLIENNAKKFKEL